MIWFVNQFLIIWIKSNFLFRRQSEPPLRLKIRKFLKLIFLQTESLINFIFEKTLLLSKTSSNYHFFFKQKNFIKLLFQTNSKHHFRLKLRFWQICKIIQRSKSHIKFTNASQKSKFFFRQLKRVFSTQKIMRQFFFKKADFVFFV